MTNYFLDSTILNRFKLLKKHDYIFDNNIIISAVALDYVFPSTLKKINKKSKYGVLTWHYNDIQSDLPINDSIKELLTAVDFENRCAPDNLIYITHDTTLGFIANHYFGNDSILII